MYIYKYKFAAHCVKVNCLVLRRCVACLPLTHLNGGSPYTRTYIYRYICMLSSH